jgi:hypothetical protein
MIQKANAGSCTDRVMRRGLRLLNLKSLCLCVSVLSSFLATAQLKPRIDFDRLLQQFPNLPWDFEIRYVTHDAANTDMLRLYYDGRADIVRWRPNYAGSLAEVCHGTVDAKQLRHVLELFRDKNFNDLPSDQEPFRTVAQHTAAQHDDATISVRLGRIAVKKLDRHEHDNPGLAAIEDGLDSLEKSVSANPQTKCGMESVPASP